MIMKANLQSLHHLSIIHVAVDWPLMLHLPPTMSHFTIINISQHSVHSMRDVLSVLRRHPQLRTLYLCGCLPQPTHESVDSVYLPKLEELILMQTDPSSKYLLESLVLPPDTWINTGLNFFHGRFLAAFFSYIKRMADNVQSKITDASIAIESDSEYVGNAMIVGLGKHWTRLSTITVLPACDNIEPPFSLLSFLRDVTHSASPRTLSSLNYLHISINDCHYPDITPSFLHLLESVDNLEDLTIEGLGGVLLDILRLPQCKSTLVPNLRHLRLSKVKVVEDIKSHRVGSLDSNALCEWLKERQACGLGIVTLTIGKGCKLHVSEPVQLHCKLLALVTELKEWERLLK
ncbi:hypothetical protein QCA50_013614 [Cerrena zonata]|uniref:F-box/LRR-repeat protein n=1 Tax=Cerrena zonata TaxID=2478898 RepID=A0AAW0G1C7_9APHY